MYQESKESTKPQHKPLAIFLRGLAMGSIDIVPGISGGTIAFITGIYPRLINSINQLRVTVIDVIKQPLKFNQLIKKLDWNFLLPLALGIFPAIFLVSGLMEFLITAYPANTFAFFTGLIIASTIFMIKTLDRINFSNFISLILGIIFAFLISTLTATNLPSTLPIIFISGAIAICAMILPGISGAFLLVLLGQYQTIVTAIHQRNLVILVTFAFGAVIGLASFSKLLAILIKKYRRLTLYSLTGIMLGALRVPYIEIVNNNGFLNPIYLLYFIVLGFLLVYIVNKLAALFNQST